MKILLSYIQAPGDTAVSTAAVSSLIQQRPKTAVYVKGTGAAEIFQHFPRVSAHRGEPVDKVVVMDNPLIQQSHLPWHFMHSYCHVLSEALGERVELRHNRPVIHLSADEWRWMPRIQEITGQQTPYWVVNQPGAKTDYTVKRYPRMKLQEVIWRLPEIKWVQVGEAHHEHKPLEGAINEIGKTDLRQLIRMIAHPLCRGVLTGESLCWHLAAAFKKPAVCLASGWLQPSWVQYPTGTILHRFGCLPCCRTGCCGKTRVVPLNDSDEKDGKLCTLPVVRGDDYAPKCLDDIQPDEVVQAVRNYVRGGVA